LKIIDNNGDVKYVDYLLEIETNPIKYFSTSIVEGLCENNSLTITGGFSQKIDVQKCTSTISTVNCRITNFNQSISKWLYSCLESNENNLKNKKATLYYLTNKDSQTLKKVYTGIVRDIGNDPYETYYDIEISDILEKFKETILEIELSDISNDELEIFYTKYGFRRLPVEFVRSYTDKWKISYTGTAINFIKAVMKVLFGDTWSEYVDFSGLENDESISFIFYDPIERPIDFLQEQIFILLNVFPLINSEGKLCFKKQKQPSSDITPNNELIIDEEKIYDVKGKKNDFTKIVNNVVIYSQYNFEEKKYMRKDYFFDENSVKKYGITPKKPFEVSIQGTNNMITLKNIANNIFSRFSDYTKTIVLSVRFEDNFVAGNYIILRHKQIINNETGERGIKGDLEEFTAGAIIGKTSWGDYVGKTENNSIGYADNGKQIIKVDKIIEKEFFNNSFLSIVNSHNEIIKMLLSYGYPGVNNWNLWK